MPKKQQTPAAVEQPKEEDASVALKRKHKQIRLKAWIEASRNHGFLQKGQNFNTIPK